MAIAALGGGRHVIRGFACGGGAVVTTRTAALDLRMVHLCRRHPGIGAMTRFADFTARNVSGRLARCRCAVVTAAAVAHDAGMIEGRRNPSIDGVAIAAFSSSGNVVGGFARCRRAIVATAARPLHLRVIDTHHRYPSRRAVARLTHITRCDMGRRFARGRRAVMARGAIVHDARMVEPGRHPSRGRMAIAAFSGSGYVIGGLARSSRTVVTA